LGTCPAPLLISFFFSVSTSPRPGWLVPCRTELLSPGVHRWSPLRTSSFSSTHSDSRPNPPFRHHFLPHVKGKETGLAGGKCLARVVEIY
jgi:hypothetical protein